MEIVIGFLCIIILGLIYLVYKSKTSFGSTSTNDLIQFSNSLSSQIQEIRKEIDANSKESRTEIESKLKDINKQINDFHKTSSSNITQQFKESNKVIKDVTTELEKIKGTNEQVLSFANQMKTLEKILGNQKQRGVLGEIQLENLLANVLPPELFQMQHSFKNKEAVDAIVRVGEYIIPIDAKFSLDNYNKMIECSNKDELADLEKKFKSDIKSRIDETAKYIRPNENTTDYAYMFIPADGLYQDLLNSRVGTLKINQRDLVSYAYTKKVMIVSPMSLFPMLQITVKALHNLKVEDSINDILKPNNEEEVSLIVKELYKKNLPTEIIGSNSKNFIGNKLQCAKVLDLSKLSGIVEYLPEELYIKVKACTPILEIEEICVEENVQQNR